MAQQTINIGSTANDGTGDPIRDAFDKANDNFTELYTGAVFTTDADASGFSFVIDEDNMASDSATKIPTQQSVKAYVDAQAAGIANVVDDTTPQLGGSLDVNGNAIVSVSNGNIAITPDGTGAVILDGLSWPTADGSNGQVLTTDGAGGLTFTSAAGSTVDVVSNVATSTILGRVTAGSGDSEELTATQVRTLINVEDGADVTDATNVDAAGATMNTDTDVSGNSWVLDEDNFASDSATKVPTQQSVKAYVDANAGGGASVNAQTGTTYTLVLGDANDCITMNNASANTLTIPTNASVAFPVGTVVSIIQIGAGATTVEGATGVTVNGVSAGSATISAQHDAVSLIKIASDTWNLAGAHGGVS